MPGTLHTLYGTTNDSDSVPRALLSNSEIPCTACSEPPCTAPTGLAHSPDTTRTAYPETPGPTYSEDGRLILSESFACFASTRDKADLERDVRALLTGDDYVETWRIWDCYADDWANCDLTVHRFEDYDLAIRRNDRGMCAWRGAIDTRSRVLASPDPEDCERKCWQWKRVQR